MPDVFISYSHKDGDYAHRLAEELRRQHLDVWIDDRIDYGDQWPRVIQENLTNCRVFVVVMSTNAFNSMWVQNEVSYAQENGKPIFPLLLEGSIWLSLASMQYVDVRNGVMPPPRFAERLKRTLGQPASPAVQYKATPAVRPSPRRVNMWGFAVAGLLVVAAAVVAAVLFMLWYPRIVGTPEPTQAPDKPTVGPETEAPKTEAPVTEAPVTQEVPTELPAADVYPPNPLGPQFSEMWFANGECYDMDVLFTSDDIPCDLFLQPSGGLLQPVNGAQITGYATLEPPSLNTCKAAVLDSAPVAIQTDLYLCFRTNADKYGFFVARQYRDNGIVFDAYVFP